MTSSVVSLERIKRYASIPYAAKRRRWRTAAADVLADVGDLVGEELAKSFNVNGRACWYSTKTHQDVDGLPVSSGPTGQLHSCRAKILCPFGATVDSKDVIYPTCVLLQYASQRRIQYFPRPRWTTASS